MSKVLLPKQTLAMLNVIRDNASDDFKNRIPQATRDSIKTYGTGLRENPVLFNEFTGLLMRIGKTIISSQDYNNPLARFKKGQLPTGVTIQDIWVDIAQSEGVFDETGANPLGRRLSDVQALYYTRNRQDKYVKSISRQQLLDAFTSVERIGDMITNIMNSMYEGSEYDEYLLTKEMLGNFKPFYQYYSVPDFTDSTNLTSTNLATFVKTLRKAYKDLQFMSREHNAMGVMRKSNASDIVVFIRKDLVAEIDVEVLASAFNINKTDLVGKIIEVEDFGSNDKISYTANSGALAVVSSKDVMAIMCDTDLIQIYDQLIEMATIYNPDGLFENYFYHIWQVFSMRKFSNAVCFSVLDTLSEMKIDINNQDVAYAELSYTGGDGDTHKVKVEADKDGFLTLPIIFPQSSTVNIAWKLYNASGTQKTFGTSKVTDHTYINGTASMAYTYNFASNYLTISTSTAGKASRVDVKLVA